MNPDYNTLLRFYKAATEGYQQGYNQYQPVNPIPQQNTNVLPPQTVIQVNGKASVDALRMSPNSSVLLLDSQNPIVWLCASDGIGNVTSVPYDITPHKDTPPVDMQSLEGRIDNIERMIADLARGMSNESRLRIPVQHQQRSRIVTSSLERFVKGVML